MKGCTGKPLNSWPNLVDHYIHSPNKKIEAGTFLGLPGKSFDQDRCLHFEIFTDDSIKAFIKPHEKLDKSDITILHVKKGSTLFKRENTFVANVGGASIPAHSRVTIESDGSDSDYVKVTATDAGIVFNRSDLSLKYEGGHYLGIIQKLSEYQLKNSSLTADSKIEFISYAKSTGIVCSDAASDDFRLTAFPIPLSEQKTYWVKHEDITTQDIKSKGSFLTNSLTELYPEKPDAYSFINETSEGCSDECYIDLSGCEQYKDSDVKAWYHVTLPFDDLGFFHPINVSLGVNRLDNKQGWIKAENTDLTSPLNWPGFNLVGVEGLGGKEAKIDFEGCSPFFSEILQDIDLNKDGKIVPSEMRAALKNDVLAERMGRVIAKHPTEWQSDDKCSKWVHLKEIVNDDAAFESAKKQITELAWWDKAKAAGADLPGSSEVYHLQGLSFLKTMEVVTKKKGIGYNTYNNDVDIKTRWKKGFGRKISKQNAYNEFLLESGKQHPDIDLIVFKALIAQESGFDSTASNQRGYAGLTQVGWEPWKLEAKFSLGFSSEGRDQRTGEYIYDLTHDERFKSSKSILGGMKVLKLKISYIDKKLLKYNPDISMLERYKLYIASDNGGQGTISICLATAKKRE